MLPARYLHGAGAVWRARAAWVAFCAAAARLASGGASRADDLHLGSSKYQWVLLRLT